MRRLVRKYCLTVLFVFIASYILSSVFIAPYKSSIHISLDSLYSAVFPEDLSCYSRRDNDSEYIRDEEVPEGSIFFIETSCKAGVRSFRRACALEAAARAHPNRKIFLLHLRPVKLLSGYTKLIKTLKISNIFIRRIDITNFTKTEEVLNLFRPKFFRHQHKKYKIMADLLKIVTLRNYGGIVIDLDMILTTNLDYFGVNWFAMEDNMTLGSAILASDLNYGKILLDKAVEYLGEQTSLSSSFFQDTLMHGLKYFFSDDMIKNRTAGSHDDYKIYHQNLFYPINRTNLEKFYLPTDIEFTANGYHLWGIDERRDLWLVDSLLYKLAAVCCPGVLASSQSYRTTVQMSD